MVNLLLIFRQVKAVPVTELFKKSNILIMLIKHTSSSQVIGKRFMENNSRIHEIEI